MMLYPLLMLLTSFNINKIHASSIRNCPCVCQTALILLPLHQWPSLWAHAHTLELRRQLRWTAEDRKWLSSSQYRSAKDWLYLHNQWTAGWNRDSRVTLRIWLGDDPDRCGLQEFSQKTGLSVWGRWNGGETVVLQLQKRKEETQLFRTNGASTGRNPSVCPRSTHTACGMSRSN